MRLPVAILFAVAFLNVLTAPAFAIEVGTDERRAGMCADFDGVAFTFCVALCEARECDRQPADDERCAVLARGFARATDGALAPCAARQTSARGLRAL